MKIDINGKRVLITASTQGIGFGIAKALAKEGCKLVITSRDEKRVKEAVTRLRLFNPEVFGTASNLTKSERLDELVRYTIGKLGGIDVLIFNTGNPPSEPSTLEETTMEDWEYSVKLYLLSAIKLSKLVLPYMVKNKWGRLIFLSSWTVKEPQSIFVLADVSRASVIQLSKIISKDYGKYNITSNVILMGSFETEGAKKSLSKLAEKLNVNFDELWEKEVLLRSPLKRVGDIEKELGSLITYLISDFSSYITGSVLLIDGGTTTSV